jgi:hypothetical protein
MLRIDALGPSLSHYLISKEFKIVYHFFSLNLGESLISSGLGPQSQLPTEVKVHGLSHHLLIN